jgi:orotidine-5'-phosphate decarboxylase
LGATLIKKKMANAGQMEELQAEFADFDKLPPKEKLANIMAACKRHSCNIVVNGVTFTQYGMLVTPATFTVVLPGYSELPQEAEQQTP